ncbi:ABC transporter permease, partial [Acinetobacter baumannii]
FFIDEPTGLVPASVWEKLSVDAGVARSVPLNMGDSHRGFPVVGTTPGYFDLIRDLSGQTPRAEPPRGFERPFEAVLGAVVARQLGLAVGDQFNAAHGMAELPADLARTHDVSPYTVVAVLQPTGLPM